MNFEIFHPKPTLFLSMQGPFVPIFGPIHAQ
jgi:hypothetical protein